MIYNIYIQSTLVISTTRYLELLVISNKFLGPLVVEITRVDCIIKWFNCEYGFY